MRISEAMRRGAAIRPQCHFILFDGVGSCAIGAAIEGAGIEPADTYEILLNELCTAYPEWTPILNAIVTLPDRPTARSCWFVVTYLNDERKWARENIADWLKGVEDKLIAEGKYIPVPEPGSEQEQDPNWCYVCDRPAYDCACELDPNGPLPQSACMRLTT